ncbi:MAG: InlB B-repeat-containing protein, partial [Clostridia bacterium]
MKCPVCGGELKEISNTQTRCESCGLIVRRVKKPVVIANAAEVNEKIDRLEKDIGTSKSRNSIGKRLALKIILPTTLLLIVAAVTLMACLMGLRGVYVNDNDPNEFVSFSALNYEYYTTKDNVDKISIGTWSRKNNVLRINESGSNDAKTCQISFKNFNKLTIDGKNFSRRNLLYFRDIVKNCTVTFDANGGDIGKVVETDFGARIEEPTVPQKDGSELGGWYTTQWGSLNNYTEKFDCNNRIWEDVTYYANWNSTYSYKVFENNTNVTDVVEGNLLLAALKSVETTGKTYEYFIRERYGSGRDWQKITDATRMPNYDIEIKKGEESNRDLKVSFDLVGGTFDTQSLSAKYAENCNLPIGEPQKDGFYFDGWSYNNTKYRAGEILWVSPATRIVGDECTLVANWVELKPVVFDSNGGSGEMATKIYAKHNDTLRLPKCTYTKTDSVFIGWSETTDNENRDMVLAGCFYKLDNQPTDTITFTARWMPKNATYFRIDIAGRPQKSTELGNHFMFGRYPQSVKEDNVTVSSAPDGDGFYLGSDGERYKKVEKATPRNDVKFMNGKEVVAN